MKLYKARHKSEEYRVKGGFNFTFTRLNSPAVMQGVVRNAERMVNDNPKWKTQPCGLFCKEAYVTGRLVAQTVSNKDVKAISNPWSNFWFRVKPKLEKLSYTTYILEGTHTTYTLNKSAIQHLSNISELIGEPNLWNGKFSDLYFFCLREGEVFVDKMLIGRNMGSMNVYSEVNHAVARLVHNEVVDRPWWHKTLKICRTMFWDLADLTDYEELLEIWNVTVKDKPSKPAWTNELVNNMEWPNDMTKVMELYFSDNNAEDVVDFSWKWWFYFFNNPYIHRYYKKLAFNLLTHWYRKASFTFDEMSDIQDELIDTDYDQWEDMTHGAFYLDPAAGIGVGGRDSTGVISAELAGTAMTVMTTEDKQRNVARGLTASISLLTSNTLKKHAQKGADNLLVDDGVSWMRNKKSMSGADSKNSDQQVGIGVNLASYSTASKDPVIRALSMVSGEIYTTPGNGKHGYDEAKYAEVIKLVNTLAGDDHGLHEFDPTYYVDQFANYFKWSFPALSAKQTLNYQGKKGWRHLVFNLGNTFVYTMGGEFLGQFRAFKLIKTEQTPIGSSSGRTIDWAAMEFAKASLDDVIEYERPLWYTNKLDEFNGFLEHLNRTDFKTLKDIPGSLQYLI